MIVTKEDNEGKVIAWAEFRLVDETGTEREKGIYVWIHDVWVHRSYRSRNRFNDILEEFIREQSVNFPWAEFIYWQRGKYGKRMSLYSRAKIIRRSYGRITEEAGHVTAADAIAGADAVTRTV